MAVVLGISMVLAVACGSGGPATSAPASVEPAAAPTTVDAPAPPQSTVPAGPLPVGERVLMVGDSGMADLSTAMEPMFLAAGAQVAERHGLMGLGLSSIAFSDQPSPWRSIWQEAIDRLDPDLVIGVMGGWDSHFLAAQGLGPYTDLVREATRLLSSNGAKVVWLSPLPGGAKDLPPELTEAYLRMPREFRGVAYFVDSRPAFTGPDGTFVGRYVDDAGTTIRLRKADDWHLCQDGAIRLSRLVNDWTVAWRLTAPAPTGWEKGAWWDDVAFKDDFCWPVGAWRS